MTEKVCPCVGDHVPNPKVVHRHHIVPKSWGGTDAEPVLYEGGNLITICPSSHENVHLLLNAYVRANDTPPWEIRRHYTWTERWLAKAAWDWWVTQGRDERAPYTSPASVAVVELGP